MEKAASLFMYLEGKTAYEMDADAITRLWRAAFSCALRDMGLPSKARRFLWDELAAGNWKHFHQLEDELKKDARHWARDFGGDVLYCSDRWSIDRITRCHWTYRQLMDALRAEQR